MVELVKLQFILLLLVCWTNSMPKQTGNGRLLYILLDGFRYDYVDLQDAEALPGFTKFLTEGVRSQWVNPLYPSISYPSWTTLGTGLYAESHNIIGNYFYDPDDQTVFSLFDSNSTGMAKWWKEEPIWTTATKAGLRAALYLWGRCDVPYDEVLPDTCEKFVKITGPEIFRTNIDKALERLEEGYDLVQVYNEHADATGHDYSPDGDEILLAVRELDETLLYLQERLETLGLSEEVNIVIVSDHGMANTSPGTVTRLELDDYLPAVGVENIADKGSHSIIKAQEGYVDEVYNALTNMPDVDVYRKDDIPESYHVKEALYMHEILVWARMGTFIMASATDVSLPPRDDNYTYYGAHGFTADQPEMRAIFFAKGPAFKKNEIIEPIDIVDIYQVLAHTLNIDPMPHNGTWENVESALAGATGVTASLLPLGMSVMASLLLRGITM